MLVKARYFILIQLKLLFLMSKFFLIVIGVMLHLTAFSQTCNLINESFESPTTPFNTQIFTFPTGWVQNSCYINNDPAIAHTGNQFVGMNLAADYVILKALDCPGDFSFWWRSSSANGVFSVNVDWSENNGTTWNTVHTINATGGGTAPTTNQLVSVNFPESTLFTTGNDILIRIYMTSRTSNSFYFDDVCVTQGVCRMNLAFHTNPPCVQINQASSFTVCAEDIAGTIDNTFTGNITVSKLAGPGTLGGTLTKPAVAGCATFNNLTFNATGNYTLQATDATPRTVNSSAFNVYTSCNVSNTSLKIMSYNILNFPNSITCTGNTIISTREDTLKKIIAYVAPDVLMVCELQTAAGSNLILTKSLNINGVTHFAAANFVVNTSSGDNTHNNMFYYNTQKMTLVSQSVIPTSLRDISKYTVKMVDPNEATNGPTYLDFYVSHLKAGNTTTDAATRAADCQTFANYMATQPARNAFFGGDFNFYSSTDQAYVNITTNAINPFKDPLNSPGAWEGNSAFSALHTQTTRATGINLDCGAQGGMDSRLDFIVTSNEVITGTQRVTYMPGTYVPYGNNGSTFNKSINDAANTSGIPNYILKALFYMSDHVPIVMQVDVQLPLALPLDLLRFEAKYEAKARTTHVSWDIANAKEVQGFNIEHSNDGVNFEIIGQAQFQESLKQYAFEHKYPENGTNYYRLAIVNTNGNQEYSNIVSQEVGNERFSIFPNPAQDHLFVKYTTSIASEATVVLYSITGVEISRETVQLTENQGVFELKTQIAELPANTYILQFRTEAKVEQVIFLKR
jgi:Secretion system C-terminal sorting domain